MVKRKFFSAFFVLLSIMVLGIPYFKIGIATDDLGILLNSKISSWQDIVRIFTTAYQEWHSTEYQSLNMSYSALDVWYRPLGWVFLGVQNFLWGNNAYGYYLVNVFLHGLNAALIFNIFLWFVDLPYALFGALFFLFHGSVGKWIGIICTVQDILNLTFALGTVYLYKHFLYEKRYIYYLFAAICFFLGLFNREVIIVLPICIFVYLITFTMNMSKFGLAYFIILLRKLYLFLLAIIFYAAVRISLFGIKLQNVPFNLHSIKATLWSLLESLSNLLGFTFIRSFNPRIKALVIVPFIVLLVYLFYRSKKKKELLFLAFCIFMLGWPLWLLSYHARYVYPCIPLYILILLILFFYRVGGSTNFIKKQHIFFLLGTLTLSGSIDFHYYLSEYERVSRTAIEALKDLKPPLNKLNSGRNIIFFGLPYEMYGSGIEQGIKMFTGFSCGKIYHFPSLDFSYRSCYSGSKIDVFATGNGYRLISKDLSRFSWYSEPDVKEGDSYYTDGGKITINKKVGKYKAVDLTIIFDTKHVFFNGSPMFITWDSGKNRFKVVEPYNNLLCD